MIAIMWRHRARQASVSLAAAALAALLFHVGPVMAQGVTYGTNQRYCDQSAISQVLSTSTGNLVGSAAGAAVGGLVGSNIGKGSGNTVATILGVLGGAVGGGYIGRSMDPADRGCVGESLAHAPVNQPVAWQNTNTGTSYWVTPTQDLRGPHGEPCRNYITDALINGQRQQSMNTACQQPDGNWVPVSANEVRTMTPRTERAGEPGASALSRDTILQVQKRLHDLGFYVRDNIDGRWGPHTAEALRNFQRTQGLKPTGQLDSSTMTALRLP